MKGIIKLNDIVCSSIFVMGELDSLGAARLR
jgi:hypothetical protein